MIRAAISFVLATLMPMQAMAERTFGLVIGIDEYTYIPDLHGAVNDAEDIADALDSLGAEVTLLTDAKATRSAILGAWEHILAKATPGDRLIISYAGHGSNEPEHTPGSEEDGRDENFLLAGFAPRGEAAGQRIRDDEIADMLARSSVLDVIFVADACHAGTVTRDLNPTLGYRYVTPQNMSGDPLPPPPPPPSGGDTPDQIALFLAAVNETEKVPEVLIDGVPRGALSFAFADGLRGAADLDRNGVLTKGELETHVRRTVRQVSDGAQLPQSEPAGQENVSLLQLPAPSATKPAPLSLIETSFADLPAITVEPAQWDDISGIKVAQPGALRREGSVVYSSIGNHLATLNGKGNLQAVIDKHRLITTLNKVAHSSALIGFDRGDLIYRDDQTLTITVDKRSTKHLTLINLSADGKISLLYPVAAYNDALETPPSQQISLPVRVTPPFGSDHVVAIETDVPAPVLIKAITRLEGSQDMSALWDLLRHSKGRIALFPFFTAGPSL
ncbi:MAG: caspase family protein [Paracoccaceae bacterium]